MPFVEKNAHRLRLILELLDAQPEGYSGTTGPDGILSHVFELLPPEGSEGEVGAKDKTRAEIYLRWSTVDLVKAGWLEKSGTGIWRITDEGRQALKDFPDARDFASEARNRYNAWSALSAEKKQEQLQTTIVPVDKPEETIRDAALPFVQRGLQEGGSVFSEGRSVWESGPVEELRSVFIDAPDPDAGNFVGKLKVQLAKVSDDARLLMAELVCWQLLPISPNRIGERAKKERVQTLLGYMDHPVQIPVEIAKAFKFGSFDPGQAMNNKLYEALVLIIELLDSWLKKTEADKEALLADPWAWRQFINDLPGHSFRTQRNALVYLVHPKYITSIVSDNHKTRIHEAFVGEIGQPSEDIDRDLLDIVLKLQQKTAQPVDFYSDPLRKAWDPSPAPGEESDAPTLPAEEDPLAPTTGVRRRFAPADNALSQALFMDRTWLQKQLNLLERRGQIILYGPPGTGKTYLAMHLAEHVAGDAKYTSIVQFHPSYSYEDFFQGYRPDTTDNGSLTYRLQDGPLRRIVDQACSNPEFNYVLVIDEINRGNLAKIFGELYFLLEYRDTPIKLQYSKSDEDSFKLPSNLFFIGTMNTSDRSIALLDAAMRRRFSFVELHPHKEPTKSVLRAWLVSNRLDTAPADLLDAVNERIGDGDFQIGPSFLMPKNPEFLPDQIEEIWDHEILPLLAEHHYGEGLNIEQVYGLDALRAGHQQRELPDTGEEEAAEGK
ncbi:AAA family ATPase [Paenarthrobacter sp. NPDC090517]|uniref:AAA family ATPase n=1 Tax=Paenarthrobacter sp. NPDC090517 TaxID=3364381 RepID=UPI003829FAC8